MPNCNDFLKAISKAMIWICAALFLIFSLFLLALDACPELLGTIILSILILTMLMVCILLLIAFTRMIISSVSAREKRNGNNTDRG